MANTTKAIATMTREEAIQYFWAQMDILDGMPEGTLDQLCEQEKMYAQLVKELNELPEEIRKAVEDSKRPKAA